MSDAPFDAETLKAYAHPLRIKMYDYLLTHGSATATQLAKDLGENTGQTSYHLRILARHGLVEDDPEVTARGRERWWRPTRKVLRMEPEVLLDPATRQATQQVLSAVVQERAEVLKNWFKNAAESGPWLHANVTHRATVKLAPEEAKELISQVLQTIDDFVEKREANSDSERQRVRIYFDLLPLLEDL